MRTIIKIYNRIYSHQHGIFPSQLRTLACKARNLYGTPALGRLEDDFNSVNVLCHPKKPKTAHGLRPLRQSFFT